MTAKSDGRVFFVLPYKGCSIVGTTEVEMNGSVDSLEVSEQEEQYLLSELRSVFGDAAPSRDDILTRYCGVRVLRHRNQVELGELSREAEIVEEAPGLLGIIGGKFTTYRAVSERCVDRVLRLLERSHAQTCRTATDALPGGNFVDMDDYFKVAEEIVTQRYELDGVILRYLLGTYGSRHTQILQFFDNDPKMREPLEEGLPFTRGEIVHAAKFEGARTLDDVLRRRTYRAFLGPLDPAARARWEDALRIGLD